MPQLRRHVYQYFQHSFRYDCMAGMTVAVLAVPQTMAYAILAGLHPAYGLYTAIVATLVSSLLRSSHHVISGTTTAVSILTAGYTASFAGVDNFYALVFLLTFLVGAVQVLLALVRAGDLEQYVSSSVLLGFTITAAVLIGLGQLHNFLGIPVDGRTHFLMKMVAVVRNLSAVNIYTLALGSGTIMLVLLLKLLGRNFPAYLLAMILSACAVYWWDLEQVGVATVGEIPRFIPMPQGISFDMTHARLLVNGAVALAIVGIIEGMSSAKMIAARTGQVIAPNREILGQGMANVIGAFFQSMPSGGSFTRSALNYQAGARTRMAGVFSALITALIMMTLAPWARYIPIAALAAVLLIVSVQLIDRRRLMLAVHSTGSDLTVLLVTALAGIIISIEAAIYVGIALSIALFLRKASVLNMKKMVTSRPGQFHEVHYDLDVEMTPYILLQLEGDLFFGAAGDLERKLQIAYRGGKTPILLRLKRTRIIDLSILEVLQRFNIRVRTGGGLLILSGVEPEIRKVIERSGIDKEIGLENVFYSGQEVFESTQRAIKRAEAFLADLETQDRS